jgi:dTDP-glucose 4,6-dehydratase
LKILVTGGAGFIGSHFCRTLLSKQINFDITVLDNLSYSGNINNLSGELKNINFLIGDIRDEVLVSDLIKNTDFVVNFAAQSHVDRSIEDAADFISTNIVGVHNILSAISKYSGKRFLQISTDEVYGSISLGSWNEESPLLPNSPYSASKASADLLIRSYYQTHKSDVVITRCSNNYGSYQFIEKFIPLSITNLIRSKNINIYGSGKNIRDWIHVEDHCEGIYLALMKGKSGEIYNLSAECELDNLEVANILLKYFGYGDEKINFVKDRPGHDYRYSVSCEKAKKELGFTPKILFNKGIEQTIFWYLNNQQWWQTSVAL